MYQPVPPCPAVPAKRRYLEAVTVSVGYHEFLAQFLIFNRLLVDKLVVVTSTADKETQNLCETYNVECVVTDCFYEDGAKFNKGKGINEGLKRLRGNGWTLHLDSDVILPPHFRTVFDNIYLDEESIYGCDRLNVAGFENWVRFMEKPKPMHQQYFLVHGNHFPLASHVAHYNQEDGWFPLGFYQLWNRGVSGMYRYPEASQGADHTDVVFAKAWTPKYRRFMAELFVYHLESENAPMGANWSGRTSAPFTLDSILTKAAR